MKELFQNIEIKKQRSSIIDVEGGFWVTANIDNVFEKTFDNFKKITPALIAVSIITALILFLPKFVLNKMSLDELPAAWQRAIGLIFLSSVALIVTIIISSIAESIRKSIINKWLKRDLKQKLKILSSIQKDIILDLLNSPDKTIKLDSSSGDTLYLVRNLFLHRPQQVVSIELDNKVYAVYTPQPWLMDLFNEEPELFS